MLKLITKLLSSKIDVLPKSAFCNTTTSLDVTTTALKDKIGKLFCGSLAIRVVDAGSDNACEQELVALSNRYYDVSRFGVHFVASPRHADMLLVTGPVTRNMAEPLKRAYEATPNPKLVVAIGDDAIGGEKSLFHDSYAVIGAVSKVIPVDYVIPGDPPTPKEILSHLLLFLNILATQEKRGDPL